MLTGRFNENFRKADDLPNHDLPRDTPEDVERIRQMLEEQENEEE